MAGFLPLEIHAETTPLFLKTANYKCYSPYDVLVVTAWVFTSIYPVSCLDPAWLNENNVIKWAIALSSKQASISFSSWIHVDSL